MQQIWVAGRTARFIRGRRAHGSTRATARAVLGACPGSCGAGRRSRRARARRRQHRSSTVSCAFSSRHASLDPMRHALPGLVSAKYHSPPSSPRPAAAPLRHGPQRIAHVGDPDRQRQAAAGLAVAQLARLVEPDPGDRRDPAESRRTRRRASRWWCRSCRRGRCASATCASVAVPLRTTSRIMLSMMKALRASSTRPGFVAGAPPAGPARASCPGCR